MRPLWPLAEGLAANSVRYLLIGVSAANLYGPAGQAVFVTDDFDLFLPPDPDNLVRAWSACESVKLDLWLGDEPLDSSRDRWLAVIGEIDYSGKSHRWRDRRLASAGMMSCRHPQNR